LINYLTLEGDDVIEPVLAGKNRDEWGHGELFPTVGFIVTDTRLSSREVVKTHNSQAGLENRIKEGRWWC